VDQGGRLSARSGGLTWASFAAAVAGWIGSAAILLSAADGVSLGGVSIIPNLVISAALMFGPLIGRWPLPTWRLLLAAVIWIFPMFPLAFVVTIAPMITGTAVLGMGALVWATATVGRPSRPSTSSS
jgi:hypothetical protein